MPSIGAKPEINVEILAKSAVNIKINEKLEVNIEIFLHRYYDSK